MKVLLVLCWFPPTNVIGSVRGYQIARHLVDSGHSVHVIHIQASGFREDYQPDLSGICRHSVEPGAIVRWLAPTTSNRRFHAVRSFVRRLFYPDPYITLRSQYAAVVAQLLGDGFVPDLILSSALPFSLHSIAQRLANKVGASWIADNRDLWATSAYRRRSYLLRQFDKTYQRRLLRKSQLVLAVGRNMAQELRGLLGADVPVRLVRNGADTQARLPNRHVERSTDHLRFVYTGTLYGGFRDVRPLLSAIRATGYQSEVGFYAAEPAVVKALQEEYPEIRIKLHEAVSKSAIKEIQRRADFLVVALGDSEFEKGVLTGKFFEYVESRRPIVAICARDSELAQLVKTHNLGIATRKPEEVASFLRSQAVLGIPDLPQPDKELDRTYQLSLLEGYMTELLREE